MRNGGKFKNPIVLKMWGRERGKVEGSAGKLSQIALFSNFPPKFYNWGEISVQKYVIKGLPTI